MSLNRNGTPSNLVASHPANTNRHRHGAFSPRLRESRAQEVADAVMSAPHVLPIDHAGALEIGRVQALVEALDEALADGVVDPRSGKARAAVDLRLRASKRLTDLLTCFGLTPKSRWEFAARLASASDLQRRLAEIDDSEREAIT